MIKFTDAETAKTKEAARKPGDKIEAKPPATPAPSEAAAPKAPTAKRGKSKAG
jgi:hypothetical protein